DQGDGWVPTCRGCSIPARIRGLPGAAQERGRLRSSGRMSMTSLPQRYQLLEEVGQGGMAKVYRGLDTTLDREVAVKVLHPHLAALPESRSRLEREAHAVAKLRHENILEIYDYSGPESADSYIVTEFIHGTTLKQFVSDHPLDFPEVAEMIASEVA